MEDCLVLIKIININDINNNGIYSSNYRPETSDDLEVTDIVKDRVSSNSHL